MAKVVKAYSIDSEVAEYIDRFPSKTRSKQVNFALRSYFFSKYGEQIVSLKESRDYWMHKCLNRGGFKHHLRELLRCLNPFLRRTQE